MTDTNRRAGEPTRLDDAMLKVLSPRVRELVERGGEAAGGQGNAYVSCKMCRDTGWIPTPAGSTRCPHAAAEDRRVRLEHHIKESGTGELGRTKTFATFETERCADPNTVRVRDFLKNLASDPNHAREEGVSPRKGLLIAGHTGSGKSHLLRATTMAARERGVLAVFTEFYKLVRRIQDSYNPKRFPGPGERPPPTASEILGNLAEAELVCLDDLGGEPSTDHNTQVLYELLDALTARDRTVVISTNLSREALRGAYGDRILSRISGLTRTAELKAERDHRAG